MIVKRASTETSVASVRTATTTEPMVVCLVTVFLRTPITLTHVVMQYQDSVTVSPALLPSQTLGGALVVLITLSTTAPVDSAKIVGVIPWVQRHAPLLGHVSAGRTIRASAVISASPNTTALTLASVSLVNVINTEPLLGLSSVTPRVTVLVRQASAGTRLGSVMDVLRTNT